MRGFIITVSLFLFWSFLDPREAQLTLLFAVHVETVGRGYQGFRQDVREWLEARLDISKSGSEAQAKL